MGKINKYCPHCQSSVRQCCGKNRSGSQRVVCECGKKYTINPKVHGYPDEVRKQAIKMHFTGSSGRQIGNIMGFSKANIYNWAKKIQPVWISEITFNDIFEIDELWHFVKHKEHTETHENTYVIPIISRTPRQIVSFGVENSKSAKVIQAIADKSPYAYQFNSDGYFGYMDVVFPGYHKRNSHDKKDTHNIESVNADIRHYIPGLRRRSRCFYRSLDTLRAIFSIFVNAYNKFGEAKLKYRRRLIETYGIRVKQHNWYKDLPLSIFQFF